MTVVVIRAMPDRWRGFLQSVALEIGIGTFVSPDMRVSVRERIWQVAQDWFPYQEGGSFVMTWIEAGNLRHLALGETPRRLLLWDGVQVATMRCKSSEENNLSYSNFPIDSGH
jgi:CRISPR-associated protein Cas2